MNIRKRRIVIFLILLLLIGLVSFTAAKYINSQKKESEMLSSGFHISSNYLKDAGEKASYTISDWGDGFDIDLYNYETSNIALIAEDDISYTVTVSGGWIQSVDGKTSANYTMKKSPDRTSQIIHIAPPASAPAKGSTVTVTVTTTSPYSRKLTAEFTLDSKKTPDYSWSMDESTGITQLVIESNDYSGTFTVKWKPAYYTPDTTNSLMSSWIQADGAGTLTVDRDSAYTLNFMINGSPSAKTGSGSGTSVELK